jgi:type IV secretory pathway VirB2 component (pilin)
VSTAFRIALLIAVVGIALALLLGPAWRGSFYRSWLRPRLVAVGVLLVLVAASEYLFRVITAIRSR